MPTSKKYAKMGGMFMVPMKRPPGRPPKLDEGHRLGKQRALRLSADIDAALEKYRKRHNPNGCVSDVLRDIVKARLSDEGLLKAN